MPVTGKGVLRIAVDDFIKDNPLGKAVKGWVTSFFEMIERAIFGDYSVLLKKINTAEGFKGLFDEAKITEGKGLHQGSIFSLAGFGNAMGSSAASALMGPYIRLLNYELDKNLHTTRLDPGAAIAGFWRDPSKEALYENDLGSLGWDKDRVEILTKLMRSRLTQAEWIALVLRGNRSEEEFKKELRARGFLDEDISSMLELAQVIPSVTDLISMAVREAWNEDVVRRFKYDEGLPTEAATQAQKQGLSGEWFKRYWRAHWNIPSPTQGYEMLHRLREGQTDIPFTMDDLRALLTTADYPEFFRDRLIAISYSPYTRVDIRRMYSEGILSEADVYEAYRDIGYDEEHAKNLQKFTVELESNEPDTKHAKKKALTKATFLQGYELGVIDEATLREKLAGIPLSEEDIDFEISISKIKKAGSNSVNYGKEYNADLKSIVEREYSVRFIDKDSATKLLMSIGMTGEEVTKCLELVDYKYNANRVDEVLGVIKEGYLTGSLSYQTVVGTMGKLGLTGASQDNMVTTWNILKELRIKELSEAQLRTAFKKGVITADEYKAGLKQLMYSDKAIDILVKLYTGTEEE